MITFKRFAFAFLLGISFVFVGCTEESESVVPDLKTSNSTTAEGTDGVESDPDRD